MMRVSLGRHVLGLAAILFGVISVVWHDFGRPWQQIQVLGDVPHRAVLVYLAAFMEIVVGLAIQWRRTARTGAVALGCVFLFFALMWVPRIAKEPLVYDRWGNFFEQFLIVSGPLVAYALVSGSEAERAVRAGRIGYIFFGICVISFTLEQFFYLSGTARYVPKWIPPGPMFWAITTTIAFALAAIALLSGWMALFASRLLTAMIVGFGILIWLPAPFANPHQLIGWAGNAQNAIAGAAWIVADYLSSDLSSSRLGS